MSAYLIADVHVINRDKYDEYRRALREAIRRHGGRYLARGQAPEVVQGGWAPLRMFMVEFEQRADADALIASDEYARLAEMRANRAMLDMVLVDGVAASRHAGAGAAPVYAVADTRIVNRPAFEEYKAAIHEAIRSHHGHYLVLSEQVTTVAGNWAPQLLTVLEFPDRQAAIDAHTASRYQDLRDLINNTAMIDMVLLSGALADVPD